jgi:diguanylate cyclase (GGDEF)-like protein
MEILPQAAPEPVRRDPLTALLSRDAFLLALERELDRAARYERELTLVVFDVAQLAVVNDRHGPEAGDLVLRSVAETAVSTLRRSDVAGRLGGDEFGVLLLETGKHAGERFLGRLRQTLARVQISSGCVQFPDDAEDGATLLRLADQRRNASKRAEPVE